jgi:hypothetical protein
MTHIADTQRAKQMLELAAKFIETHCPAGTIDYDDDSCDGLCLADDCRLAPEQLDAEDDGAANDE